MAGGLFDPKLSGAYCRAYNCWIVDFCSDTGERLVPADVIDVLQLELMVEKMPASTRRAILADNVAREYCLD